MNKKHFTATGIILSKSKILVIWHEKLKVWLPPGGHIEKNEAPEEALKRECKEEINQEIKIINNANNVFSSEDVKVMNNPYCVLLEPINEKDNFHYHVDFIYLCKLKSNFIKRTNKIKWVSIEQINKLKTFENVKKLFKHILN